MNLKKIVVTGHPYAFPYYFRVFEYLEDKDKYIFVLPKVWKSKTTIKLENKEGFQIYGLNAWSYGGKSLLGGLFKGWLPGLIFLLPYLRVKKGAKVLYSCSEPNLLTTLANGLVSRLCGMKLVLFTWQNVEPEKRSSGAKLRLSNWLVSLNLKLADGIICGNRKAEQIVKRFKPDLETLVCPLSGVDTDKFKPGIISDWKVKLNLTGKKAILFYGALDKRKGIDILLESFKKISDNSVSLIIAGRGPEKEKLVRKANNLGLDGKVVFLDWLKNDELPGLICAADIFVYPSVPAGGWEEQFGYAMAEASACGLPVVSTKTGSISEVVIDGESGILVEAGNVEQLAKAMLELLNNNEKRKRMGEFGGNYVLANFSHQIIAKKIIDFLGRFANDL